MLKRGKLVDDITEWLAHLQSYVLLRNNIHYYDENTDLEPFFQKVFSIIYDLDLINLNDIQNNYPAIDLGDEEKQIAIQVTTEKDKRKIDNTLEKFVEKGLNEKYKTLKICIFNTTRRYQKSFKYAEKIGFNRENIVFSEDLIKIINSIDDKKLEQLHEYIGSQINKPNYVTEEITKLLEETGKVLSEKEAIKIYYDLSKYILDGHIEEVLTIKPLIQKKNDNLELGINYLLGILSNQGQDVCYKEIEENISIQEIFDDLTRYTIYVSFLKDDNDVLNQIGKRNAVLYSMAQDLINQKYDSYYDLKIECQDGNTFYKYDIKKNYISEEWLLRHVCMVKILEQDVINASIIAQDIIEGNENLIDRIYIYSKRVQESINVDKKIIDELYNTIVLNQEKIKYLSDFFQIDYYISLLRIALLMGKEKVKDCIDIIPVKYIDNPKIMVNILQYKVDEGNIGYDELVTESLKLKEFWVLHNYLLKFKEEPGKIIEYVDNCKIILEKDTRIFLLYVQCVYNTKGKADAIKLLEEGQSKHENYLEYWIDKLRIDYSDELLDEVYEKWISNKYDYSSYYGTDEMIEILMQNGRYSEATFAIERHEKISALTNRQLEMKAKVLYQIGREIESLDIFNSLYGVLPEKNAEIAYYIMNISLRTSRQPSKEVLDYVGMSSNPILLTLGASYYNQVNSQELAKEMIFKALIRTTGEDVSNTYGCYMGIYMGEEYDELQECKKTAVDSIITLRTKKSGDIKQICIAPENTLPRDSYIWKDIEFIYKDTAIIRGLFRKSINDIVKIGDGNEYNIEAISHTKIELNRICMKELKDRGVLCEIKVPIAPNGKLDIEVFAKELSKYVGDESRRNKWLEIYKDFQSVPMPFYYCKKFTHITYSQLIKALVKDNNIVFREQWDNSDEVKPEEYILSYSALVALNIIGYRKTNAKVYVPKSTLNSINYEKEEIINRNSKEHAATIGVDKGNVFFNEFSELEKSGEMDFAVGLQAFANDFECRDNNQDLSLSQDISINPKELLGINDYDAFSIASEKNQSVVTAEIMVHEFGLLSDISVKTLGIANFLADTCGSIEELFACMEKMLEYKFEIPLTENTIIRIINDFNSSDEKGKEKIFDEINKLISISTDDEKYLLCILNAINNSVSLLDVEQMQNPIVRLLILKGNSLLKYISRTDEEKAMK